MNVTRLLAGPLGATLCCLAVSRVANAQAQSSLHAIEALSLGSEHSCALMRTSVVRCWGNNADGRLGDGTTTSRPGPTQVRGLSRVQSIAAGGRHTCALLENGTVRCWGLNEHGQLGDGSRVSRSRPVAVRRATGITQLVAGGSQTCMLREEDGAVLCTGGLEGGGVTAIAVPGLTHAGFLAAGASHTCAVMASHVYCWGRNDHGQIGDGTREARMQPVQLPGLPDVSSLDAYGDSTCASLRDGSVWCWGANDNGQLGQPAEGDVLRPRQVQGASTATRVEVGAASACVFRRDNTVQCWGRRSHGEFGDGTTANEIAPPSVIAGVRPSGAPAMGGNHVCAVFDSAQVRCWGDNSLGQLGSGTAGGVVNAPAPVHGVLYRGVPPL